MRFGCCGSMISPTQDPVGIEIIETLAESGFDYIELSLRDNMDLSEAAFLSLLRRIERSGIRCEVCNNFFPTRIRLTGPTADVSSALDYAEKAMERAARLGARIIVFGSSGARNIPHGFAHERAWGQLAEFLVRLGPLAEKCGMAIAVEPINASESNIINLACEGLRIVKEVNHPNIQLLIDFYHLTAEKEDPEIVLKAGSLIRHVHFAEPEGRIFPKVEKESYVHFFSHLRRIHYSGRCSIEAYSGDFKTDARRALRLLKGIVKS
jgi:sugar phosphate isomerase/epimerase